MRVLVDLLGFTGGRGGTETYARELLPRIARLLPDARFAAVTGRAGAGPVAAFFPGKVHTVPWAGASAADWALGTVIATPLVARRSRADLVWVPANFGPITRGGARVVTVHDAIYDEVRGSAAQRVIRAGTSWLMRRSAQTADRVITVSKDASESIQRHLRVAPQRIEVIHNGSADPRPVNDPRRVLAVLSLPADRPIVLTTGNRMPHKNLTGLLDALAAMPVEKRPLAVIAGSTLPDPLAPEVARRGLDADVLLPGWVDDDVLEALFQVADLYVCPSLAEGFGLPVVDALRRSVPVVANDIPVLREVGGDAVTYAPATAPGLFAEAISVALETPRTPEWHAVAAAQAATFTWDRAAANTAHVLQTALRSAQ